MARQPKSGLVKGPGTPTSDSILARVSKDEYILPAESVRLVGKPALEALRQAGLRMRQGRTPLDTARNLAQALPQFNYGGSVFDTTNPSNPAASQPKQKAFSNADVPAASVGLPDTGNDMGITNSYLRAADIQRSMRPSASVPMAAPTPVAAPAPAPNPARDDYLAARNKADTLDVASGRFDRQYQQAPRFKSGGSVEDFSPPSREELLEVQRREAAVQAAQQQAAARFAAQRGAPVTSPVQSPTAFVSDTYYGEPPAEPVPVLASEVSDSASWHPVNTQMQTPSPPPRASEAEKTQLGRAVMGKVTDVAKFLARPSAVETPSQLQPPTVDEASRRQADRVPVVGPTVDEASRRQADRVQPDKPGFFAKLFAPNPEREQAAARAVTRNQAPERAAVEAYKAAGGGGKGIAAAATAWWNTPGAYQAGSQSLEDSWQGTSNTLAEGAEIGRMVAAGKQPLPMGAGFSDRASYGVPPASTKPTSATAPTVNPAQAFADRPENKGFTANSLPSQTAALPILYRTDSQVSPEAAQAFRANRAAVAATPKQPVAVAAPAGALPISAVTGKPVPSDVIMGSSGEPVAKRLLTKPVATDTPSLVPESVVQSVTQPVTAITPLETRTARTPQGEASMVRPVGSPTAPRIMVGAATDAEAARHLKARQEQDVAAQQMVASLERGAEAERDTRAAKLGLPRATLDAMEGRPTAGNASVEPTAPAIDPWARPGDSYGDSQLRQVQAARMLEPQRGDTRGSREARKAQNAALMADNQTRVAQDAAQRKLQQDALDTQRTLASNEQVARMGARSKAEDRASTEQIAVFNALADAQKAEGAQAATSTENRAARRAEQFKLGAAVLADAIKPNAKGISLLPAGKLEQLLNRLDFGKLVEVMGSPEAATRVKRGELTASEATILVDYARKWDSEGGILSSPEQPSVFGMGATK